MKLRDRQKRVSVDIKQEDCKPDLTLIGISSSTVHESSTWSRGIKQEDTKNCSSLLQQTGKLTDEFEGKSYYYRCDICRKKMPNLKSVIEHRKSVHNIKRRCLLKIKDINIEPDIHDPNFYCKSCEVDYSSRNSYRNHLRFAHYMVLKAISSCKSRQNTISPDPDDPNLYCRACDHTYANRETYKFHCRYRHGMASVKLAKQSFFSNDIIDTYCELCDVRLARKISYKRHLFAIHKLDWRQIHQEPRDILPDVSDPNFYCCACQKKLANKYSFKTHLMLAHAIYQSAPKKTSLQPDIDDPNYNCRVCQKSYRTGALYRAHVRIVHQMALSPSRAKVNPGKFPDLNDPHYYCSVCKKSWISRKRYRAHCKFTHFMTLPSHIIANSNAVIDINHPEHYCTQCERSYSNKRAFKTHLNKIHDIW
ncbi:hypothetical protein HMPREF1544_07117 [Mucor circinelloides 1006PhL]|uniref:C2H2-type domain-containing protein n=1 Tax=Mucor circinelloides f. circinelloides (strain 1006PhL) TaxID=1220926 RepID=S2J904_MUCC1|nr:hypothetical protein HMPREF1544_07117 [Mucor circinelloides 1006PhL]